MRRLPGIVVRQAGFTLIELLVVMGIFAITAGIVTVSLVRPQATATAGSSVDELVADIRAQQLKAMLGDSGTGASAQPHGIYVQTNQYTLFMGSSYNASDADNIVISAKEGVSLSSSFPSSQLIFAKGTGEVSGFVSGSNIVSVESSVTGDLTQVIVNRLGAIAISL
jgi:prepilin-type N-terminal cleavage/methylation domain-containing protein